MRGPGLQRCSLASGRVCPPPRSVEWARDPVAGPGLARSVRLLEHQHPPHVSVFVEVDDAEDAGDPITQRNRVADAPVRDGALARAEVIAVLRVQPFIALRNDQHKGARCATKSFFASPDMGSWLGMDTRESPISRGADRPASSAGLT
jgi:hypothetical protein